MSFFSGGKQACLLFLFFLCASFGIDSERFSINGFTSLRIDKQVDDIGYGDKNFSFDAELFDLLMNFQIGEQMRVVSNISWNHGVEKEFGHTNLEYAFFEQTWVDEIKFRIGKISTPFGLYNEIRLAGPAFYSVEIPHATADPKLMFTNGYQFFPTTGVGLALQGEGTFDYDKNFSYYILIANGFQDTLVNPYQTDENFSKSLTVRTRFDFNRNLKFGKSIYLDNLAFGEKNLLLSDGYDLEFTLENLRILGELTIGTAFGSQVDLSNSKPQQIGWYLQSSYSYNNGCTPYLRYETLKLNFSGQNFSGKSNHNSSSLIVVGLNYEFSNWYSLKTEVDYFFFGKQNHFGKTLGKSSLAGEGFTEIKSSLVIGF